MSDDPKKRGKADRIRIQVGQVHERSYWAKRLFTTHSNLAKAVREVGPMVKDVKAWLIKQIREA